jgi:hypothetical protein
MPPGPLRVLGNAVVGTLRMVRNVGRGVYEARRGLAYSYVLVRLVVAYMVETEELTGLQRLQLRLHNMMWARPTPS